MPASLPSLNPANSDLEMPKGQLNHAQHQLTKDDRPRTPEMSLLPVIDALGPRRDQHSHKAFCSQIVSMGGELSVARKLRVRELNKLIKQDGLPAVTLSSLESFLKEVACQCPWSPETGSLDRKDWQRVGTQLFEAPRAAVPHLLLWQRCSEAVGRLDLEEGNALGMSTEV
uniref:Beta-retroviral matrix protein domain-containing protein n=1 Tax=Acrobeloides nanus TaxID=290746 RepID=A0A914CW98_9BILA